MSVFSNPASRSLEQAREYTAAVVGLLEGRDPFAVLRSTPSALAQALQGLSDADLSRPEAEGQWSTRQVVQHLADSELVWGYRLRMVLAHDRPSITGYDQDLWARRLNYAEADVAEAVKTFETLRGANLQLLSRASAADLKRVGAHAERGEESIEHMIRLYAGHDLLHLNQLARIRRAVSS